MTHGALFAGIGGFGLAAQWAGIENVWANEIDPEQVRMGGPVKDMKMFPTPRAQMTRPVKTREDYHANLEEWVAKIEPNSENTGQLNPMWVEWLMGYPIGWTDLKG